MQIASLFSSKVCSRKFSFSKACRMLCHIEYMADVLTEGNLEERVAMVDELMRDGKIVLLKDRIAQMKREVVHHGKEPEIN